LKPSRETHDTLKEKIRMPAPTAKLGAPFLSPTDIRSAMTKVANNRHKHQNILDRITQQVSSQRASIENSLSGLDARDRRSVVNKAVSGRRQELMRDTEETRLLLTRELDDLRRTVRSAAVQYESPVQMLMRDTIGSEKRSMYMQQIAHSGPAELASLAAYAAATGNKDLSAALISRVSDLPRAERPFSAAELADVHCGELHRELSQALVEVERRVLEALDAEQVASTGKGNAQRQLEIAMLKKREQEIGAYVQDGDEDEEDQEVVDQGPGEDKIARGLAARRNGPSETSEAA
jgi:hypothetical protein